MSGITTHVLDTAKGRPAAGVPVTLERRTSDATWELVGHGATDADGRLRDLLKDRALEAGTWRITFEVASYHRAQGVDGFYPEVAVAFVVGDAGAHYHVPLLLSPFGFSTYRGS
jgi:5-hydroxyisourate hydrolase